MTSTLEQFSTHLTIIAGIQRLFSQTALVKQSLPNGSAKFCKEKTNNVLENLTVLAQHEPNQTYMEDDYEVSMKLFL